MPCNILPFRGTICLAALMLGLCAFPPHGAQTVLQGAYPSKPCKTEFLWKAVVVWRHILYFFLGILYSVRAKTETQPDAGTLENDG